MIVRYFAATDAKDPSAIAACFAESSTVVDEGQTYSGRSEIERWRRELIGKWSYTTTITGASSAAPGEYRVSAHLVGDFPGGEADLSFDFTLAGDEIVALHIG
ncbi:MAG: hypothetical protein JWQ77_2937 [Jatrophihabitans sp.]|nr:hypothetical protein [Jatrophihabitans sp.]